MIVKGLILLLCVYVCVCVYVEGVIRRGEGRTDWEEGEGGEVCGGEGRWCGKQGDEVKE